MIAWNSIPMDRRGVEERAEGFEAKSAGRLSRFNDCQADLRLRIKPQGQTPDDVIV